MSNHSHDHPVASAPGDMSSGHSHAEETSSMSMGTGATSPVPLAEAIYDAEAEATVDAGASAAPVNPFPGVTPGIPPPPFRLCIINLKQGCYRITFKPTSGFNIFRGTMRVEVSGGNTTISGDLYRFLDFPFPFPTPTPTPTPPTPAPSLPGIPFPFPFGIPIYSRSAYHSYLKVTRIQRSPIFTNGPCLLTLTAQEYVYKQPPAGSFNGTFPAAPGTRTVTIVLSPAPAPTGFSGPYFEGKLFEGGVLKGTFSMGWVSSSFRRATVEIDTLTGSVPPTAVPALSGGGTEDIRTVFATAGWDVNVIYDQVNVPVPAGVTATNCWSSANLHALMLSVRNPATNLDTQWRLHLVVVPAQLGCGRGVMYDQIGVPREGVASFSDDGYPAAESANFGAATNQLQRNVPRAYLRSACHELGHGFNQIHQEQEGGADNSIMTTTPSVADVLGGPATGTPGVFPTNINLGFNAHVRHHLIHFPDIVVRPGGMTFGSGHSSTVPQADESRNYFSPSELELRLTPAVGRVELGEPLELQWELVNTSAMPIPTPTDIGVEAQHAFINVIDPNGVSKPMASFVIRTDEVKIDALEPQKSLTAATRVFWSARSGFAFDKPGRHTIEVRILWGVAQAPLGVKASTDVWVNYPQSVTDSDAAETLLHPDVGMYVALGGGATHLTEAVARLDKAFASADASKALAMAGDQSQAVPKAIRGYRGILPFDVADADAGDMAGAGAIADADGKVAANGHKARGKQAGKAGKAGKEKSARVKAR